tara:strand:- start:426 stop:716 length:291 start_codon:yes stop_codon:yes gene_type:complete
MLIRKSSKSHDLKLYRNTNPGAIRTKTFPDKSTETVTYPTSGSYFLMLDGKLIKQSDDWNSIEQSYVDECQSLHGGGSGRMLLGKHKLVQNVLKEL